MQGAADELLLLRPKCDELERRCEQQAAALDAARAAGFLEAED